MNKKCKLDNFYLKSCIKMAFVAQKHIFFVHKAEGEKYVLCISYRYTTILICALC